MAGKSTFLQDDCRKLYTWHGRSPGLCGKNDFYTVKLFTSMRTTDSLSDNESYFYAELKRLKMLKSKIERGRTGFIYS